MPVKKSGNVTMRIRVGDSELEVTGPRQFVEAKISEFLEAQKRYAVPADTSEKGAAQQAGRKGQARAKQMSVSQFFKKLGVKTDIDRALAAGYYLETSKGEENFTAAEVRETIRGAKVRPPVNPSDAIAKNIRKGYIMAAGDKEGKRAFVVTSDGEDEIAARLEE